MEFDIVGKKAYLKYGPHSYQLGIIGRNKQGNSTEYSLTIDDVIHIEVELKELVLVDVSFKDFHDWCEKNGYMRY
ncbi:DUF3912 family protein [Bacillus sp. 165]|uniref:DUF3912 family protein n=1 Tax=Bacillus sp. 165 TaxID=1529117 RepID=UPI001ADAD3C9|nr:DUF3912 family protein [Bacillus sp. 165]MBO9129660.1 DUF3912 family protein [Bacillus sp. 165]